MTDQQMLLNRQASENFGCFVTHFHFYNNENFDKGYSFVVPTELDAYKAAYIHHLKYISLGKPIEVKPAPCGGWLVSIGGVDPFENSPNGLCNDSEI